MVNNKGSFGQAVLAGLIVAAGTLVFNRAVNHSEETATAASIATLTANVANLSEQVRRLSEQPYATRADLANVTQRLDGLDQRLGNIERAQLERRQR